VACLSRNDMSAVTASLGGKPTKPGRAVQANYDPSAALPGPRCWAAQRTLLPGRQHYRTSVNRKAVSRPSHFDSLSVSLTGILR
jgi:hypothetical protein